MSRGQFFAATTDLDRDELRAVLWHAYWRGPASVRERIETGIRPERGGPGAPDAPKALDPVDVLSRAEAFVELARAGAYLGGDRRVSPTERTRWRFTFRRLVADARESVRADGTGSGAAAMIALIDLAYETRAMDYVRSNDPVEAAGLVVSDEVALLWARVQDQSGFVAFAELAAAQLIRWESAHGWTRYGGGRTAGKERPLADVAAGMLPTREAWLAFAASYLDALDGTHTGTFLTQRGADHARGDRAESLARWHQLLLDRLVGTAGDGLLDRLASHPALGGPELVFVQACLAHRRGETDRARQLVGQALRTLPGHPHFLARAAELGADTAAGRGPARPARPAR